MAEEAAQYKADGWQAYKIHPPARWREDIAVCEAVRAAVGGDFRVMLDSTWSYNYEEAIRVGRAIEALGYHWYEDPLADDDIYNCVKLREKLDIPLMATEYSPGGFTSYVPWITMRATDYLRGDVAVKGGITPVLKTARLAEAFGMNYEIHPRRQLAQQLGQSARHRGHSEHEPLRSPAAGGSAEVRGRGRHRARCRGPRACAHAARHRRRDRLRPDRRQDRRRRLLTRRHGFAIAAGGGRNALAATASCPAPGALDQRGQPL